MAPIQTVLSCHMINGFLPSQERRFHFCRVKRKSVYSVTLKYNPIQLYFIFFESGAVNTRAMLRQNLCMECSAMKAKIYGWAKIVNQDNFTIGDFSQIDDFVFLNAGDEIKIGRFVHISSFCSVSGGGKFYMDDFSGFSAGVRVITGSDDFSGGFLTNPTVPCEYTCVKRSRVHVGKHAIVGTNVIIFPGVTIGDGAAVGAGCIVRKNLEPWTVYAGQDCQPIKSRDKTSVLALEAQLKCNMGLS